MKILLSLLSFVPIFSSAQVYFSTKYDFGGGNHHEFYLNDTGLVVINNSNPDYGRLQIVEFDLLGNPKRPSVNHYYNHVSATQLCNGCLEPIANAHRFIMAQSNFDSSSFSYIHFTKFNRQWGKLDTLNYNYKDSLSSQALFFTRDSDSTIVLTGYTYYYDGQDNYDLLLARFDTAFNLLWETQVEDGRNRPFGYRGGDIEVLPNGDILVGAQGYYPLNSPLPVLQFENKTVVARFDGQTGQKIWLTEGPGPLTTAGLSTLIRPRSDGNYTYVDHLISQQPRTSTKGHLRFGIITPAGAILKDSTIGFEMDWWGINSFGRTSDGNYVVAGETRRFNEFSSFAFKFSEDGDSIWFRDYFMTGDTADFSHLTHFRELPDSGFIGCGYYLNRDTNIAKWWNWLLRVDQYGCEKPGCESIGLPELGSLQGVELYPNPNNGVFYLEIPEGKNLLAEVYNVAGERFYSAPIENLQNRIELKNAPPGLYMLKLVEGDRIVFRQKIILQ